MLADFNCSTWRHVYRSEEWFWRTLKENGLRFRVDRTPYECAICLSNPEAELEKTRQDQAATNDRDEADRLEHKARKLLKKKNNKRIHEKQVTHK